MYLGLILYKNNQAQSAHNQGKDKQKKDKIVLPQ